jgi:putative transposase
MYPVVSLLQVVDLPKSNFYYWDKVRQFPDKYKEVKESIKQIFSHHGGLYGYRRVASALHQKGATLHQNTVQALMQALGLKSLQRVKKYKSYKGEVGKAAPNLMERQFTATEPNLKWVTDVTEFKVQGQKLYLSPILDLFNKEIVSYTMCERPVFSMVEEMTKAALAQLKPGENPMLHSDQGWHYRMPAYRKLLDDRELVQSMSRKGNCHDNAAMESFFGVLKSEFFHLNKFATMDELKVGLVRYIHYYNHDRIKLDLGGLSPAQYRAQHLSA